MSNRAHKGLSQKLIDSLKSHYNSAVPAKSPEVFQSNLDQMLNKLQEQHVDGISEDDILKISQNPRSSSWQAYVSELKRMYSNLHHKYQNAILEEKAILRIEKKAHRQAVFYRFLTTLAIGLGVILVYATADYFKINMPLLRIGL